MDNLGSSSSTTNDDESRTTILSPGVVESRNYNSKKSQISDEIQAFISGTDGNYASSPRSEFRTFFTIWMFLTRLPSPSWIDLHPGFLMRGMSYFPVVGSLLGVMYAIIFDCLEVSFGLPATISAALSISFGLYVTGCFHEDGLADSADGLGGGWSRSQVLKIMTDSRVGTFGAASLSLFLFTKLQLLGTLGSSHWKLDFKHGGSYGGGPAILVAQTLSRLSAPYLIRTRDYVAEVGPKSPFYLFMVEAKHIVSWPRVLFATLYSFGLSYPGYWFVIIEPGEGTPSSRTFLVHESRMYEVYDLLREYKAKSYRIYKARGTIQVPRVYYVAAIGRYYIPQDTRFFKPADNVRNLQATETNRYFTTQDAREYTASETTRIFKVLATREYNL